MELIGIFVGHLYFFLMFKYPQDFGGQRFLTTPSILYVLKVYFTTVIRFLYIAYRCSLSKVFDTVLGVTCKRLKIKT